MRAHLQPRQGLLILALSLLVAGAIPLAATPASSINSLSNTDDPAVRLPDPLETEYFLTLGAQENPSLQSSTDPILQAAPFYALGWSESGLFAYVELWTDDKGLSTAVLTIQDVVEDKIFYQDRVPLLQKENFELFWDRIKARWSPLLSKNSITRADQQLGLFPLILDNEYFTLSLDLRLNLTGLPKLSGYKLALSRTGVGIKTLTEVSNKNLRSAQILGFLPSPFEDRLVVLILTAESLSPRGSPAHWDLFGASLKTGFKAP